MVCVLKCLNLKGDIVFDELKGFYKKNVDERRKILLDLGFISQKDIQTLDNPLDLNIANNMIENVIGKTALPFSIATNFIINGEEKIITMATEEPSIVAAASKSAKLCKSTGGFQAFADKPIMRGQVQIIGKHKSEILNLKEQMDAIIKEQTKSLEKYGGGFVGSEIRELQDYTIYEFDVNVSDSMGANRINTCAEIVGKFIEDKGFETGLKILTNLAVKRIARAKAKWRVSDIGGQQVAEKIIHAYKFAEQDVFRASTHNKGIMNGIDAVCVATGNDFRACEAAAHTYAYFKNKKYGPLTKYWIEGEFIYGEIELPCAVGIVGGATKTLDTAKLSLKIMKIRSASDLSKVMASVGLAQNFAALLAMATKGIQYGHMKLHSKNIAVIAGATQEEIELVSKKLIESKKINVENAKQILSKIRQAKTQKE